MDQLETVQSLSDPIFGEKVYLIRLVRDTNIRETTGFNMGGDLALWPEEAWYLINRGQACGEMDVYRSDINAFYSHIRMESLFLTRNVSFKSFRGKLSEL